MTFFFQTLFHILASSHQAFYEVAPLEPIIVKDLLDQLSASVQGQIERVGHSHFIARPSQTIVF
jgi:hypothetical protein